MKKPKTNKQANKNPTKQKPHKMGFCPGFTNPFPLPGIKVMRFHYVTWLEDVQNPCI